MAALTIPTIFTVIDKITAPVVAMGNSVHNFATKSRNAVIKVDDYLNKLTPSLSNATKQFLSFASAATIAAAIVAGGSFSVKSIMDYQTEIQNLSAITGTSGKDLDLFKSKIKDVANDTKSSSIEVVKAFTMIGNNSPALLKDADALAEVTKQSIILSRASKMDLATSASSLTDIMNQFNKPAKEAKSVIDLLAGGMVIGSTDIDKISSALSKAGGVASQVAGASLPEVVTAIEAISDKMKDAELIGTQFRNIFLIMSNIKGQDPKAVKDMKAMGVNMDLVAKKGAPLIDKLNELKKLSARPGALEHVFGKENMQSIIPLLASTDKYVGMLEKLTTSEDAQNAAQKMADKNSNTLAKSIEFLKNKYVTFITTSDKSSVALNVFSNIVKYAADHLNEIINIAGVLIGVFLAWKTIVLACKTSLFLYNVAIGIHSALTLANTAALEGNVVAITASTIAEKIMTGWIWLSMAATKAWVTAQWLLNAALAANPIGLIIIGIAALVALIVVVIQKWNEWGAALSLFLGPLGMVISLIQSFRRNWEMISQSFKTGGILEGLKAIGKTILDAVIMPIQQLLGLIAKFTGWDWASSAAKSIESFRADMGVNVNTDEAGNSLVKPALSTQETQNEAMQQIMKSTKDAFLKIDINDPNGRTKADITNNDFVHVRTTSTMQP